MRHLFIINPTAGKHNGPKVLQKYIDNIKAVMDPRGEPYEIQTTIAPGDAEAMSREYAERYIEPLRIYVYGGDGTLNEVVNGVAGYDHAAVTVYPCGSGNDFIKNFRSGAPRFRDLNQLVEGQDAYFDLIECNGRLGLNIGSLGLDARVGLGMVDFKHLPLVTGSGAYILSTISNVIKGIHRPYQVELDGQNLDGEYTLFCICNGRYYGGAFNPSPVAVPNDGLLDFILVRAVSRLTVATLIQKYATAQGAEYPGYIKVCQGRSLKITCDRTSQAQLDGERLEATTFDFHLSDKKLHFFYPRGASFIPTISERMEIEAVL